MIIYFFGQPHSGKTTLAQKVRKLFWDFEIVAPLMPAPSNTSTVSGSYYNEHVSVAIVDGDNLRAVFNDKDFSDTGRRRNIERAMNIALWEASRNNVVICSLVTPFNFQRLWLQNQHRVMFVYLTYNKNDIRGREQFHAKDFDQPSGLHNLIELNTSELSEDQCIELIKTFYKGLQEKQ